MAVNFLGMLAPAQNDESAARREAMALASASPDAQINYQGVRGAQMLGQGLGGLLRAGVGAVSGVDTSTDEEKKRAAKAEIAARLKDVDPSDIEFFPVVIEVLRKYGFIAEALEAAREYEAAKRARKDDALKEREQKRKEDKDDEANAIAQARLDIKKPGSALVQALDRLEKLYAQRDSLPEGSSARKNVEAAIKVIEDNLNKKKVQVVDAGDRKVVLVDGVESGREIKVGVKPGTGTTVGPNGVPLDKNGKPQLSEAEKKFDQEAAKDLNDWMMGGFADVQKGLTQLQGVISQLTDDSGLTGPKFALIPRGALSVSHPEALQALETVEEVVQRNLRLILGAQFTEKEGERLIKRAYNIELKPSQNRQRLERLVEQMRLAAKAKNDAAEYLRANRTLAGWRGVMPSPAMFDQPIGGGGGGSEIPTPAQAEARVAGSGKPKATVRNW